MELTTHPRGVVRWRILLATRGFPLSPPGAEPTVAVQGVCRFFRCCPRHRRKTFRLRQLSSSVWKCQERLKVFRVRTLVRFWDGPWSLAVVPALTPPLDLPVHRREGCGRLALSGGRTGDGSCLGTVLPRPLDGPFEPPRAGALAPFSRHQAPWSFITTLASDAPACPCGDLLEFSRHRPKKNANRDLDVRSIRSPTPP